MFKLPFGVDTITAAVVSFRQPGGVSIDKTLEDCTLSDNTLSVSLTEEETLSLRAMTPYPLEIQLRVGVGQERMASQIWKIPIERTLKEGGL